MITQKELLNLLKEIESDRVEKTESNKNIDKLSEAVCAFANDIANHKLAGYLLIGVKDNGILSGLTVTDQMLQNLAALRSDGNIQPLPMLHVAKFSFPEGDVAVVEVIPADMPPVRYRGRAWVRVGTRRAIASEADERRLLERRTIAIKTFDAQPCKESTINDLALELFLTNYRTQVIAPEVLAENHREVSFQLASLRFFDMSFNCPTYAGILLFAKDLLYWLPGAYIQFLRIDGDSFSDPIKNDKKLFGDLLTLLRELDALLDVQVTQSLIQESNLREKEVVDYPVIALRELLMNAVMHRSYESTAPIKFYWFNDRIEIQSPGGLYGEASQFNFPQQNSYRNPIIAEAMKALGYVNKFGRGVLRAQEALRINGNKPAEFIFDSYYVLATLWKRP